MRLEGEGKLLRIFLGETDRWHHRPLYEEIVRRAREMGLAVATVIRGIEGFGANSHLHTTRILRLSEDLPLIIEVVDTAQKVDELVAAVEPMIEEGLMTVERVQVLKYRARPQEDE